jgi:hypothetical protein
MHAVQEHNLDHNQFVVVRDSFNTAARQIHHKYKLEIGSSDTQTVTTYKPGGTALIAQGNITGRVYAHGSDPHGRWSYMTLNGTAGVITMIISAYQVCTKPTNPQGITAYHQKETVFHRQHRSNTNPHYNFRHDLIKFIQLQQARGIRMILLGDFNQHIDTPNGAVHSIAKQCNLIDVWKCHHPNIPEPNTYLRGKTRIDYALVSPAIANAVQAIGYEPFHHTAATDHRGIFLDLATEQAFGGRTNTLETANQRTLQTKRHLAKITYIRAAASHGNENNLFE